MSALRPAENSWTLVSSIAEGNATLRGQRGEWEGIPAPAERPGRVRPVREDLPVHACANLSLLYQGTRASVRSPFSRPSVERGGMAVA